MDSIASHALPTETTGDVGERKAPVAVLPIGSFEQHGRYLPLVTDTVIACAIAREVAAAYPVQPLPPLTFSCSHEHAAWPGTVSISAATLYAVVRDIADSLRRSGIGGLVLVNGHGGNYVLRNVVQEIRRQRDSAWRFSPAPRTGTRQRARAGVQTPSHSDMHAGEVETSILLHAHPDWSAPVMRPPTACRRPESICYSGYAGLHGVRCHRPSVTWHPPRRVRNCWPALSTPSRSTSRFSPGGATR